MNQPCVTIASNLHLDDLKSHNLKRKAWKITRIKQYDPDVLLLIYNPPFAQNMIKSTSNMAHF